MLSIIVAVANNNVIGGNNTLLWRLPEDLKRFKKITSGHTIIMGRKTFESLPGVLPNRKHIIITRDENYVVDNPNVEVIHNIDIVINKFKASDDEAFVIGGGEIYTELIHNCAKLYLTKVIKDFNGDTTFPLLDLDQWETTFESEILEENNINYQFIDLKRKKG